ncbi:MAG: hypothetical protein ACP5M7_09930, partial [Thermoproteota archaeon]
EELKKILEIKAQPLPSTSLNTSLNDELPNNVEFKISHSKLLPKIFLVSVPSASVSFYAEIVEIDWELYSYYFYGNPKFANLFKAFSRKFPPKALLKMFSTGDSKNES